MRIVLSGLFYPLAMLKYFLAALERRDDVELFTAGPYSGTWIPWNGGMQLPAKYAIQPDLPIIAGPVQAHPALPISYVETELPWVPDAWIQIDAGWYLRDKPTRGKNIIVATDPHVIDYDGRRQVADTLYCMQTPYMRAGDQYLPYAHDPIWHAPEEQPRNHDVCLLGLHYQNRNTLVEQLRARGVDVYYELGPCFDEARALYNQAPIGLNWSSLQDLTARVFELLGMRRLAVVNRVPDLDRFFVDGADVLAFDTLEEAVDKVLYALAHPDEAEAIANQGHETVQPHTWDARVTEILEGV